MRISVTDNVEQVLASMAPIPERMRTRAITDALRRTAQQTKTVVARAITSEYAVQRSRVDPLIVIRSQYSNRLALAVEIDALPSQSGKRAANVIRFLERQVSLAQHRKRMKQSDRQLHFRFRKGVGTKIIKGAFVGNSGRTIFQRTGRARVPIEPVMVIDVPQMFTTKRVHKKGVQFIRTRFPVLLKAEVEQEIRRLR